MNIPKQSLFITLGIILTSIVIIIMSAHSSFDYIMTKRQIIEEIKENSTVTLVSLQKNLSDLVSAYAINEYDKFILHEMDYQANFAIIVEDYNMGNILGKESYISGKIRTSDQRVIDYDSESEEHKKQLEASFYTDKSDIFSSTGEKLGTIRIFISDAPMKKELNEIIIETLITTVVISLLLVLSLFLTIRFFILKPISEIINALNNHDDSGIPVDEIPIQTSKEIASLSNTINSMIETIRTSRIVLYEQKVYLQSIIDGIDDPILVINPDFTVELINNAAIKGKHNLNFADMDSPKCYEYSHNRSKPCHELGSPCPLADVMGTLTHSVVVHEHVTGSNKQFVELSATPLFDKNQNCIGIIESSRDITSHLKVQNDLRKQKLSLHYQATHDALTGLANRILFNDRLEQSIHKAKRNKTKSALLFIDLDHFKKINDSLGHTLGDDVLKIVARRLNETIRKEDSLARLGGDEFTVIAESLAQGQDATLLAKKILDDLSKVIIIDDKSFYISSSIGISVYPEDSDSSEDLIKYADAAMYKAKSEGRNNFQYYSSEMTEQALERVIMEANLQNALENEEFVVFYQPQVNAKSNQLIGMEALVRWRHPSMGLVSPAKFIPIAESSGLIVELDRFVMKSAMTQVSNWYKAGLNPGVLAMNLEAKQLQQSDFMVMFESLIKQTGCKIEWLELEVTESHIMRNPQEAIKMLNRISTLGVELAVDDFGTGYSSLAYLKKLPINKLKIDQSFVKDLPYDDEDVAIAQAVIALARSLNLRVIAEGVETKEQKEFLLQNGCENIQGYFYAKPMPASEMEIVLMEGL